MTEKVDDGNLPNTDRYGLGVRHIQLVLLFMCMVSAYLTRVNLSMAIVAMTDIHHENPYVQTFNWDANIKGKLLSSFFWGYLVMNVPAAVLNQKFNRKFLLGMSIFTNSILVILTPLIVTYLEFRSLLVIRICQGLVQGFMMPTMFGLLAKWIPPLERARTGAIVLGGINFGSALSFLSSGFLANTPIGWPLIFYTSGAVGVVWTILWILLGANSPDSHRSISDKERSYLKSHLKHTASDETKLPIPWKKILSSPATWAIMFAHMGQNWGMWTALTDVPTFFSAALNFDIRSNGILSALPYIIMWVISFPISILADILIRRRVMTIEFSRKMWNNIGQGLTALFVLSIPFVAEYSKHLAVAFYTIGTTLNCCVYFGFNVNHMDVSPNFSSILMGLSNGSANITAILGPLFVGFVVEDETSIKEWRKAFMASALFFLIGDLLFTFLGSGKTAEWNSPEDSGKANDEDKKSQIETVM